MKTVSAIIFCFLLTCFCSISGKGKLHIVSSSYPKDSSDLSHDYYHIYSGQSMTMTAYVIDVDPVGFYDGPADSIVWTRDGSPDGVTYGAQTKDFLASGEYEAIGYWGAWFYYFQRTIVFANWTATSIPVNTVSLFDARPDYSAGKLVIDVPFSNEAYTISLYSMIGKREMEISIPGNVPQQKLSLNGFSEGVYIVVISNRENSFSRKIFLANQNR